MAITQCVECDKEIDVEPRRVGLHVICHFCGAEMEVVSTDPLELDLVAEGADVAWGLSAPDDELDELDELEEDEEEDDEDDEFDEEDDDFDDLDDDEYDDEIDDYEDDEDDDYDDFDDDDFDDDRW